MLVVTARQPDGAADQYSPPFLFLAACLIHPSSMAFRNSGIWELNSFESLQFHFTCLSSSKMTLRYCHILKPFKTQENLAICEDLKTLKTIVISNLSFGLCPPSLIEQLVRIVCSSLPFTQFPIFPLLHALTFSHQLAQRLLTMPMPQP